MAKSGFMTRQQLSKKIGGDEFDKKLSVKELGKVYVHLVPPEEKAFLYYGYHYMPVYKEVEENGRKQFKIQKEVHTCLGEDCPTCKMIENLKLNENIDNQDIIIDIGEGRNKLELCKGEIIGAKGFNSMTSLKSSDSVLAIIVQHDKPEEGAKALELTPGLFRKINKVILDQIEELGEEKGDPFIDGNYALKLTYDKESKDNNTKYTATAVPGKQLTDEILDQFDSCKIDLFKFVKPENKTNMINSLNEIILEDYLETLNIPEPEKSKKEEKPAKKTEETTTRNRSRNVEPEEIQQVKPRSRNTEINEEKPRSRSRNTEPEEPVTRSRSRNIEPEEKETVRKTRTSNKLKCPHCDEEVSKEDEICPGCGEDLVE